MVKIRLMGKKEDMHAMIEYYGAAEPPVRCGEVLPQLSVLFF